MQENILSSVLKNDKQTYEQLHLKVCKQILHTSKRASNLGVRSDPGRLPLMLNIICSVCKFRMRLESYGEDDLLYHALKSQKTWWSTRFIQVPGKLKCWDIITPCSVQLSKHWLQMMTP